MVAGFGKKFTPFQPTARIKLDSKKGVNFDLTKDK